MSDYRIICRNCDRCSINDYYGYCSISCCADFAHKYNLSFEEAKLNEKDIALEELEEKFDEMERDRDHYEDRTNELYCYEEKYDTAMEDIEVLKKVQHAEKALEAHREMEIAKEKLWDKKIKIDRLNGVIEELEKICKRLRVENKILNDKYSRYEIMDLL